MLRLFAYRQVIAAGVVGKDAHRQEIAGGKRSASRLCILHRGGETDGTVSQRHVRDIVVRTACSEQRQEKDGDSGAYPVFVNE